MLVNTLSQHLGASPAQIEQLLRYSGHRIQSDPTYLRLLDQVDSEKLGSSMVETRLYMDRVLPELVTVYKRRYELESFPLDGFMVSNWIVGYLHTPERLSDLLLRHTDIRKDVMQAALPEILDLLGGAPQHPGAWQRAFATIAIPLIVATY